MVKKLQMIKTLEDMKYAVERCAVWDLTSFRILPNLTKEDKDKIEEYLKYGYNLWANSWILPQIEQLIKELQLTKNK